MKWFDSARARLRLLFARRAAESRMNDEFRFHVEMETDQLMRAKGLAPDEARRQAVCMHISDTNDELQPKPFDQRRERGRASLIRSDRHAGVRVYTYVRGRLA